MIAWLVGTILLLISQYFKSATLGIVDYVLMVTQQLGYYDMNSRERGHGIPLRQGPPAISPPNLYFGSQSFRLDGYISPCQRGGGEVIDVGMAWKLDLDLDFMGRLGLGCELWIVDCGLFEREVFCGIVSFDILRG